MADPTAAEMDAFLDSIRDRRYAVQEKMLELIEAMCKEFGVTFLHSTTLVVVVKDGYELRLFSGSDDYALRTSPDLSKMN